jgi:hypothetical protein
MNKKQKKAAAIGKRLAVETLLRTVAVNKELQREVAHLRGKIATLDRKYQLILRFMNEHLTKENLADCLDAACRELAAAPCDRCAP